MKICWDHTKQPVKYFILIIMGDLNVYLGVSIGEDETPGCQLVQVGSDHLW